MKANAIALGSFLLAVAAVAPASQAQQQSQSKKADGFVGGGILFVSTPHTGVDPKAYLVPLFGYEGERFYLRGIFGGYRLFKGERWSLGPVLRPRFEGYDAQDSAALVGMQDRDWSLDAGAEWSWLADWGLIGVSLVTDVLGRHHGQELELSYTARFSGAGFEFIPSAALRWRTDHLVDYYYGVRAEEATAGRPAYEGDDTITPAVRLAVRRKLSSKWSVLGAAQYEWLGSEITDSPIVEDSSTVSLMLGLTYAF